MKNAPISRQHHDLFIKYHRKDREISDLLGEYGLIKNNDHVSQDPFTIPQHEYVKIADRELHIRERFEKYVKKYIKGANAGDKNILNEYRYSTMQNYHAELKITPPKL